MTEGFSVLLPVHQEHKIEILVPDLKLVQADLGTAQLTPELHQTAQAQQSPEQERESQQAAALMGMWMGTLLLHDLAGDHLSEPVNDERPKPHKKPNEADEPNI